MSAPVVGRSSKCFPLANGSVIRVTAVDGCGQPFNGQCVSAVSDAFSSIEVTANTQDSTTTQAINARGRVVASKTTPPKVLSYGVNFTMVEVQPIIFSLISGAEMLVDPVTNQVVGFAIGEDTSLTAQGFALEAWADSPSAEGCDPDAENAEGQYVYQLFPFLQGGVISSWTLGSDFVTFSIQGATTKSGTGWGIGPYADVYLGAGSVVGHLPAGWVDASKHFLQVATAVAPPEPSCDCLSSGDEPTTATAGNPGSFDGEWVPETLLDLGDDYLDITASPPTAWTTGQHVVLGDGSHANWTGSAWAAGNHA